MSQKRLPEFPKPILIQGREVYLASEVRLWIEAWHEEFRECFRKGAMGNHAMYERARTIREILEEFPLEMVRR